MTNWYHAVCHEHREVCSIFVCNSRTGIERVFPDDAHTAAVDFLARHYTCRLQLQMDDLHHPPSDYKDCTPP